MGTEIELKYLVNDQDVVEKVTDLLTSNHIAFQQVTKQLANCYFDTADLKLRKKDYGLRVRANNGVLEQTIKTSGVAVGGMHQRPEYNVDITEPFPDLSLFPAEIWRDTAEQQQLQTQLISLFDTDFTRFVWLIEFGESQIELAYDRGDISSDGKSDPINELELELVHGDVSSLYQLARLIFSTLAVRPGIHSKAARGYRLWQGEASSGIASLKLQIANESSLLFDNFIQGISHCIEQLQLATQNYISSPSLITLTGLVDVLAMLRHGFWLFDGYLAETLKEVREELSYFIQLFAWLDNAIFLQEIMNKTGNYRKKLELSEQLIEQLRLEKQRVPEVSHVVELLHSERFNLLQLALVRLVVESKADNAFLSPVEPIHYRQFASEKLSASLHQVTSVLAGEKLTVDQYLALRKLLRRSLLTGSWFASLYDHQQRDQYRTPWLDIQQGLGELQSLWLIHQQLKRLDHAPDKLINWQKSKVENLLLAIEHSRQTAVSLTPYWLN